LSFSVRVFDVGHGDSLLIESPSGKIGIVDCNKKGESIPLLEFIQQCKKDEIEFICLTHPHSDHYSGMLELLEFCTSNNIKIKNFFEVGSSPKELDIEFEPQEQADYFAKLFTTIYKLAENNKFTLYACTAGRLLMQENNFSVRALAPNSLTIKKVLKKKFIQPEKQLNHFLNRLSIILLVKDCGSAVLLLADAESGQQKQILSTSITKAKINLFKISHHGSKQGYCEDLIERSHVRKNSYAAISTGCLYGTPSHEVITSLSSLKIKTYSTNYVDFGSTPNIEEDIPGVSRTMNDALYTLTDPSPEPKRIIPYHGDIFFRFEAGQVSVSTSTGRAPV